MMLTMPNQDYKLIMNYMCTKFDGCSFSCSSNTIRASEIENWSCDFDYAHLRDCRHYMIPRPTSVQNLKSLALAVPDVAILGDDKNVMNDGF